MLWQWSLMCDAVVTLDTYRNLLHAASCGSPCDSTAFLSNAPDSGLLTLLRTTSSPANRPSMHSVTEYRQTYDVMMKILKIVHFSCRMSL